MHLYLYRNIFVIKHTSWKMKAHEIKSSFWTAFLLNDAFFQTSAWSEIRKHQKWDQRCPASQVTMATLSSLVTYCCLYCSTLHYTTSLNHWYNQDASILSRCLCQILNLLYKCCIWNWEQKAFFQTSIIQFWCEL